MMADPITAVEERAQDKVRWDRHRTIIHEGIPMRIESDPCTEVTREPGPLLGGLLIFICAWTMEGSC